MKKFFAKSSVIATIGTLFLLLIGSAWAEVDRDELKSALYALHAHQAELAELAKERTERDEVASLANTLERDHGLLEEWLYVADNRDAPPEQPREISHDRDAYAALRELEGEAFDEAFLAYQMELHRAAIEYLEQNRSQGDEQLDEFHNHLFITHETLIVNGELIDTLR